MQSSYSWSKFGREAEFVITIYLKFKGWNVQLSRGSRGPADIIATYKSAKWLIQVKSSNKIPRLKGYEVKRLTETAENAGGLPVIATLQPVGTVMAAPIAEDEIQSVLQEGKKHQEKSLIFLGNYAMFFYSLLDWKRIIP